MRSGGNRLLWHYYDMHMLLTSEHGQSALGDVALGADCVAHARMFFNRPDFDPASARSSSFAFCPKADLHDTLRRDYAAMTGMILGEAPSFEALIESVAEIQNRLNAWTEKR